MSNNRIRLENYLSSEAVDVANEPSDRVFYAVILSAVFVFFIITYPYRDIRLPTFLLALVGLFVLVSLTISSWLNPQFYWASIAFCIYIPFSGQYPGDFGRNILGVNFTNILLVPVLIQLFMQRTYFHERLIRQHAPDVFLLIFCLLSSLSLIRGAVAMGDTYFDIYLVQLKRWILPFAVYFIYVNMARNPRGVKHIIVAIGATITAVALLAMKESFDIGPRGSWDRLRIQGVLGQANSTGAFFVYYPLIFLGFWLCNLRDKKYWLLLIPFVICGRAMTLANSRGGIIAFTLAMLATLWFRSKWLFLGGLIIVVLGSAYPQYLPETISGRLFMGTLRKASESPASAGGIVIQAAPISNRLDASARGRITVWRAGLSLVRDNPWFGHGYGMFPKLIGNYDPNIGGLDPHNAYLGIAAEMGLFALFFFVMTLLLILRSCLNVYHHSPDNFMRSVGLAGVGMIMGVISANFFGSRLDTMELTAYLWILSAIIVQYDWELRQAMRQALVDNPTRIIANPWAVPREKPGIARISTNPGRL